jgi:hypothetical protein
MDVSQQFDVLIALLKKVVAARGQNPDEAAAPYLARRPVPGVPSGMVTLGPMLTGSSGPAASAVVANAGIVPVPEGMSGPRQ